MVLLKLVDVYDPRRYWLALHPDIGKPIGGVKQMHDSLKLYLRVDVKLLLFRKKTISIQAGFKVT